MQGVPQQFPFEKDCAQFRHLSHLPGVELYQAHIERYAFEPHTHDAFAIGTVDTGRSVSAIAARSIWRRRARWC